MAEVGPTEGLLHGRTSQVNRMRELLGNDTSGKSWEAVWKENVTPWDFGQMKQPLKELIESKKLPLPTSGMAIVPGCGRGYEAIYIASALGLDTIGIDIAPTAIEAANANLRDWPNLKARFECTDFYQLGPTYTGAFDLAFDYTFFVAIHPKMRSTWGAKMCEVVKKGGYLVTLVYPIGDRPGGPPYAVSVQKYAEALGYEEGHWKKVLDEDTGAESGTERIVVWQRI